ncbi:nucleoside hydrolase [Brevibacillus sp. NRS-1366]|uniref:nucleoside hydrolase n=1 Tax=Brevibacillus sp. NRS-1366 TaxID=3233899 RepID=UPI003D25158B
MVLDQKQRVLIDFCGGVDHAVALLYALQEPNVQVVGVICSDTVAERGTTLAQKVIDWAKPGCDIPVVAGDDRPLFATGTDSSARAEKMNAGVRLLVDEANKADGELTLITLGRLTTLARAAACEPLLAKKLKRVIVQGGAIRVPGDVTAVAEANIYADPEAAAFVLAAGLPVVLVPIDVTHPLTMTESKWETLLSVARENGMASRAKEGDGLQDVTDLRLHAWGAMVAALHPARMHTQQMKLTIECASVLSRGAVLADLRAKPSVGTETEVCVNMDINSDAPGEWLRVALEKEGNIRR